MRRTGDRWNTRTIKEKELPSSGRRNSITLRSKRCTKTKKNRLKRGKYDFNTQENPGLKSCTLDMRERLY